MNREERNVTDNLKGIEYEKSGDIEKAIELYERVVSRKFDGSHPYDRLSILYRKQGNFEAEETVLKKAISVFTKVAKNGRCDGPEKLEHFQTRLDKLHKKIQK